MGTPRITIVGGGSTHWTPRLLTDFANTESLREAEVTLMDVDPDSLPLMVEVAEHIAKVRDIGLTVRTTTDLADALDGAEFVIVALSVGGFASMRHDLEIPSATAFANRSATASAPAVSAVRCAACPWSGGRSLDGTSLS